MKIFRQGDVLLKLVKKLPVSLKEKDKVLAYGEVTGHKHQFLSENAKVFIDGKTQYCVLEQDCELVHEEHAMVKIPKGIYEVVIQREVDLVGEVRQVMD